MCAGHFGKVYKGSLYENNEHSGSFYYVAVKSLIGLNCSQDYTKL